MALAESAGLSELVAEHVTVPGSIGSNAEVTVASLVAGILAGADSTSDMDLLRHGGMGRASSPYAIEVQRGDSEFTDRRAARIAWLSPPALTLLIIGAIYQSFSLIYMVPFLVDR